SSITTLQSNRQRVRQALRKLELDFRLVSNEGVLSILPPGVDKAYGVRIALRELGVSPHNLAAIGDNDNDLALFALAEHAAAVRNAPASTRRAADRTLRKGRCDGFLEFADELLARDLVGAQPRTRIIIGHSEEVGQIDFAPSCDSVLICGPEGGGQAAVCDALLEQLLACDYQCCMIGARFDGFGGRSCMAGFGAAHEIPRLTDVLSALEQPQLSAYVDLAALPLEGRPAFTEALLLQLLALHDRVGRPHCVLIDQAESLVRAPAAALTTRLSEATLIYSTAQPELLSAPVVDRVRLIVSLADAGRAPDEWRGRRALQAQATTAGGVVRRISVLRPASTGELTCAASSSASDAASAAGALSGY